MSLTGRMASTRPAPGEMAVFYLAQAGFYFKTAAGKTVCLDPYLGDGCERLFNFKRMVPAPMAARELRTDFLVSTHSHTDHLDPDLLELLKQEPGTLFVGSPDCRPVYQQAGIADGRVTILAAGDSKVIDEVGFRAVYADHGELAPDAVGLLITLDGITVYDTGDTAYCPEQIMGSLGGVEIDIMIAPINSAYGNLGHEDAVRLAALVQPRVLIGSHFGMFIEHGGDPGAFLACARQTLPETVIPIVLAPGEKMIYSKRRGMIQRETLRCSSRGA
jgi:L-ascorbate 6-phosphate lactonase